VKYELNEVGPVNLVKVLKEFVKKSNLFP